MMECQILKENINKDEYKNYKDLYNHVKKTYMICNYCTKL